MKRPLPLSGYWDSVTALVGFRLLGREPRLAMRLAKCSPHIAPAFKSHREPSSWLALPRQKNGLGRFSLSGYWDSVTALVGFRLLGREPRLAMRLAKCSPHIAPAFKSHREPSSWLALPRQKNGLGRFSLSGYWDSNPEPSTYVPRRNFGGRSTHLRENGRGTGTRTQNLTHPKRAP